MEFLSLSRTAACGHPLMPRLAAARPGPPSHPEAAGYFPPLMLYALLNPLYTLAVANTTFNCQH